MNVSPLDASTGVVLTALNRRSMGDFVDLAHESYCGGATTRTGNTAAMSAKSSRLRVITAAPCNNAYPDAPSRAAALLPDKPRPPALQHRGEFPLQRGEIPLEHTILQQAIDDLGVRIHAEILPRLAQFFRVDVQCFPHLPSHVIPRTIVYAQYAYSIHTARLGA